MGHALSETEGPSPAYQYLLSQLASPPSFSDTLSLFQLGTLSLQLNLPSQALPHFLTLYSLLPRLPPVLFQLAYIYQQLDDPLNAIKHYQACLLACPPSSSQVTHPTYALSIVNLSALYISSGQYKSADTLLTPYLASHPEDTKALNNHLIVLYHLEEAERLSSISVPCDPHGLFNQAIQLYRSEQPDLALSLLTRLISTVDHRQHQGMVISAMVNCALIQEAKGDYQQANQKYHSIIQAGFKDIDTNQFESRIAVNQCIMSQQKAALLQHLPPGEQLHNSQEITPPRDSQHQVQIKLNELENQKKLFEEFKVTQ